jgi:hypothetical protein
MAAAAVRRVGTGVVVGCRDYFLPLGGGGEYVDTGSDGTVAVSEQKAADLTVRCTQC